MVRFHCWKLFALRWLLYDNLFITVEVIALVSLLSITHFPFPRSLLQVSWDKWSKTNGRSTTVALQRFLYDGHSPPSLYHSCMRRILWPLPLRATVTLKTEVSEEEVLVIVFRIVVFITLEQCDVALYRLRLVLHKIPFLLQGSRLTLLLTWWLMLDFFRNLC